MMKEIKAYIRPALAHRVIEVLKQAGATNISMMRVKGLGLLEDPQNKEYDAESVERSSEMVKLEIVLKDSDVDRYVQLIKEFAHTGNVGDGLVYVTDVERTIKLRTGEEGIL
ncbi:MAG: P-II family nitrogen regulator [Ignavibacteriales bacterium]|nr:P-II family nitrogen regulator [Ignavibacteriales bacterium]